MLNRIIEILIDKFIRPSSAAERAERRAKQNLVFVHEALVKCHRSYLIYHAASTEDAEAIWRSDILKLAECISNARTVLATFGQVAYNDLVGYATAEALYPENPVRDRRMAIETALFFALDDLQLLKTSDELHWDDDRFTKVAAKLRETIGQRLTPGEIQHAQEAFHKKHISRFWRRSSY